MKEPAEVPSFHFIKVWCSRIERKPVGTRKAALLLLLTSCSAHHSSHFLSLWIFSRSSPTVLERGEKDTSSSVWLHIYKHSWQMKVMNVLIFLPFCPTLLHTRPAFFLENTQSEFLRGTPWKSSWQQGQIVTIWQVHDVSWVWRCQKSFKNIFWCHIFIYKPEKSDLNANVHHILWAIRKCLLFMSLLALHFQLFASQTWTWRSFPL